jgi:hypothetical protein
MMPTFSVTTRDKYGKSQERTIIAATKEIANQKARVKDWLPTNVRMTSPEPYFDSQKTREELTSLQTDVRIKFINLHGPKDKSELDKRDFTIALFFRCVLISAILVLLFLSIGMVAYFALKRMVEAGSDSPPAVNFVLGPGIFAYFGGCWWISGYLMFISRYLLNEFRRLRFGQGFLAGSVIGLFVMAAILGPKMNIEGIDRGFILLLIGLGTLLIAEITGIIWVWIKNDSDMKLVSTAIDLWQAHQNPGTPY